MPILLFELWFLGCHHVIATYTRLCFDRKSFAEHWLWLHLTTCMLIDSSPRRGHIGQKTRALLPCSRHIAAPIRRYRPQMTPMIARLQPGIAIAGLWAGFVLSWVVAALWTAHTEKALGRAAELPYRLTLTAGTLLFLIPAHGYRGWMRLWQPGLGEAWICVVFVAAGIAFSWWARIHLGRLWSAEITRKAGHRIVETGPYALTRHPIYTGLLLAVLGTMAAKGTLAGIAGAALITAAFVMKARLEERFLRRELGAEAYDAYARRVPMLVPWV